MMTIQDSEKPLSRLCSYITYSISDDDLMTRISLLYESLFDYTFTQGWRLDDYEFRYDGLCAEAVVSVLP